jgi:hypothetical protein
VSSLSAAPRPTEADDLDAQVRRLIARVVGLEIINEELSARCSRLEAELADAVPFVPQKPPPGWTNVKRAAETARLARSTIYKRCRQGRIRSTKVRSRIFIDPVSV